MVDFNFSISKQKRATYNPYSSALYEVVTDGEEKQFRPIQNSKQRYIKGRQTISFLSNSDFIFETMEISKNIPDDEVEDAIYNIAYEELDNSIEYQILYDEIRQKEETEYRKFNIFIFEPNVLKYLSSTIRSSIKYIDRIYPIPLLFKSLYQFSGNYEKVECFIYIHRDGTSFNLFQNGELLYSKGLDFSTIIFFEYFKEYLEKDILYTEFRKVVTNRDRLLESPTYRKTLTKSLKHLFIEVEDVIHYVKRNLNIEVIDNIYYSSIMGNILGISEYSKTLIGENSFDGFLSQFSIPYPDNLDEIHYLLYLIYQYDSRSHIYIDILQPPPPFFSRPIGKLALSAIGATLISLSYPFYNYYQTYLLQGEIERKKKIRNRLYRQYLERKELLEKLSKERNRLVEKRDKYQKRFDEKLQLLTSIKQKITTYTMKGQEIAKITDKLLSYGVFISSLKYQDGKFILEVLAKSDNSITSLLKEIINEYDIYSEKIEMDRELHLYRSTITISKK